MTRYLNLSGGYFAEHQILMIVVPSALPKKCFSRHNPHVQNTARVVIIIGFAFSHGFMQVNMLTRYLL